MQPITDQIYKMTDTLVLCTKIALFLIRLEPACRNQQSTDFFTNGDFTSCVKGKKQHNLLFSPHANNMAHSHLRTNMSILLQNINRDHLKSSKRNKNSYNIKMLQNSLKKKNLPLVYRSSLF